MRKISFILATILIFASTSSLAFNAKSGQNNGVPLGGIGAGAVEILPDGRFANITINNNRTTDERIDFATGSFFAVRIEQNGDSTARLLQTKTNLDISAAVGDPRLILMPEDTILYNGLYPEADINYRIPVTPVKINLKAFSPVIPGDMDSSQMPAAVFSFTVSNPSDDSADVSMLFSWENLNGCFGKIKRSGRYPAKLLKDNTGGAVSGIQMSYSKKMMESYWGSYAIVADCPGGTTSALMWDPASPDGTTTLWNKFTADGTLDQDIDPQAGLFSGALSCKVPLKPGESTEIAFSLAWHFPDYYAGNVLEGINMGNYYSTIWPNAAETASTALRNRKEYLAEVDGWHKRVTDSTLPEWLEQMLINNLYVFTTNTLRANDGRYSIMETPYGPMMGTLDQRFYSSIATLLFFPELETAEMNLFADTRNPNDAGRIYHDLGRARFDKPSTGTTEKRWTDLNPKFVLMALRNYEWTGDRAELVRLYPKLKDVMQFTLNQDEDGDLLPDQHGRSTTYDDWAFYGANSYSSGLWLAALQAYPLIADIMDDPAEAVKYRSITPLAAQFFEDKLWDEDAGYYILFNDEALPDGGDIPSISRASHDGQLAGQWYADFLYLGRLFPQEHIDKTVESIGKINQRDYGVAKGLNQDGSPVPNPTSENWWSESENGWPHYETCHYASLAIYNGHTDNGLESVKKVYDNVHELYGLPWNQPLRWDLTKNGTYGWGADRYMTSPGIWHVLLALEGFSIDIPGQSIRILPRLPSHTETLSAPLRTPKSWGRLDYSEENSKETSLQTTRISFDSPVIVREIVVNAPRAGLEAGVKITAPDGSQASLDLHRLSSGNLDELVLSLGAPVEIGPDGLLIEVAGRVPQPQPETQMKMKKKK